MQIVCSICKELFISNSEVVVTKCGHMFHQLCINEWCKQNRTCPHCRTKLKEKPHRIYFNIENDSEADPSLLQYKIDNLLHKLQLETSKTLGLDGRIAELESLNCELRENLLAQEVKTQSHADASRYWKHKAAVLEKEAENLKHYKEDNEVLQSKLQNMENLKTVIEGTENEVLEMLKRTPVTSLAVHHLCIYIAALKQQVKRCEEKLKMENVQLTRNYNRIVRWLREKGGTNILAVKKFSSPKMVIDLEAEELSQGNSLKRKFINTSPGVDNGLEQASASDPTRSSIFTEKSLFNISTKIVNNLEKSEKKIHSDSSDNEVQIFPGPSKYKRLKSVTTRNNKSIFQELNPTKKHDSNDVIVDRDISFEIWGGTQRNPLATPTPPEELSAAKINYQRRKMKKTCQKVLPNKTDENKKLDCYLVH